MPDRLSSTHAPERPVHGPAPTSAPPLWLFALAAAAFATGTDDMVIAGLLPSLSADLGIGVATAGQLVTGYALVFGLGAPVLAVLTARREPRRLLRGSILLFALANAVMALAPTFTALLLLRMLAAGLAAIIVPTALAVVAERAPVHRRGRWLSIVTSGITLSLIIGVPLGTWIGGVLHWRATMLFVMALALLAAVGTLRLPAAGDADGGGGPVLSLRERLAPLARPVVLAVTGSMIVAGAGGMMGYIYLAPLLQHLVGGGAEQLATLILIYGAAGFLGVLLGGRGADALGPSRTLAVGFAISVGMLLVLTVLAGAPVVGGVPFPALIPVTILWAAGLWSFSPPMQSWLLARTPGDGTAVLALSTCGMYLGFALGGAVGGGVLARWGAAAIPMSATILLGAGGVLLAVTMTVTRRRERTSGEDEHADR